MVSFAYLYIWYTYRVWTQDRFSCLHPKRFKQGELKSIVTLLILFMIPFQLFYGKVNQRLKSLVDLSLFDIVDITSVTIKYEEGFANILGHIFTKPEVMWTKADQSLVIPTGKIHTIIFFFLMSVCRIQLVYWLFSSNVSDTLVITFF